MTDTPQRRFQIISGRAYPELAEEVAKLLGVSIHPIELSNFANGEVRCWLSESVRGSDVFVMQTHGSSVNDDLIEQAIIIDAAKRASARSITAICPFLGYARQDRKSSGREPITARLVIDILANAGADRIMSVDLHAGQIQGFFNGPFDHLIARPTMCNYIEKNFDAQNLVIVSPDAGRVKSAERYSTRLACDIAIVHKQRSSTRQDVEARFLIGDVKGKTCIVVDDMIDTAGTMVAAADLLVEHGAASIYGAATHGLLSDPAMERIEKSPFKQILTTNTLPTKAGQSSKLVSVSISQLIADAISEVYKGGSVSAIFGGTNQA